MQKSSLPVNKGSFEPLGISIKDNKVNFAIFSEHATAVNLCLFADETRNSLLEEIPLNKTNNIWHIEINNLNTPIFYLIKATGPTSIFNKFNPSTFLLDPYAANVITTNQWGSNQKYLPMGGIAKEPFDWQGVGQPKIPIEDLIIYEMHVRGFTKDESSSTINPGTYLGVIEKIPHLKNLGINAVELMPVQEFNECEYAFDHPYTKKTLYNYWGYSTCNFFSPMQRFAYSNNYESAALEFKTMVLELHKNGIEVILDVVYNHTAEGNEKGPIFSWKGIDNNVYYYLDNKGLYPNYSGCGNTVNCGQMVSQKMILDSLRYWVTEMHVDGFRFDLGSILTRGANGQPLPHPPLIEAITNDPVLSQTKLIVEPWDAGGLYQVGTTFVQYKRWSEWNGHFRDNVRRFIRGGGHVGEFVTSLCGSQDLYYQNSPCGSLNFVTAHDGFTLADLVSYNMKHNLDNGEENRDGSDFNESWNCGVEGPTDNKRVLAIRERQMRNLLLALLLSRGVPMVLMGDEYGHTRKGNNNAWCQDNELNWFLWDMLDERQCFYRYFKSLIAFRKENPIFRKKAFYKDGEIDWHGKEPFKPDWGSDARFIAFTLKNENNQPLFYVAFNAEREPANAHFPDISPHGDWHWVINTYLPGPFDYREKDFRTKVIKNSYKMHPYSAIVLEAK